MTRRIHIGNSPSGRIPKATISQVGFKEQKKGWAKAFKKGEKENLLMDGNIVNKFDQEEWEW